MNQLRDTLDSNLPLTDIQGGSMLYHANVAGARRIPKSGARVSLPVMSGEYVSLRINGIGSLFNLDPGCGYVWMAWCGCLLELEISYFFWILF